MTAIFVTLHTILDIYWFIVIASVVISWLYVFNIVNPSNQFVSMVGQFLNDATEPVLGRIRRFMPNLGSIDISSIVLLLGILFVQIFLRTTIAPALGVSY